MELSDIDWALRQNILWDKALSLNKLYEGFTAIETFKNLNAETQKWAGETRNSLQWKQF